MGNACPLTCSVVSDSAAHQDPLYRGSPRQEFWSGLPFPSPGDLSNPGIKPASPSSVGIFLTTEPPGVNHFTLSPNTSMNFCFPTPLTTNGIYRCFTFCPNSLARPDYLTLVLICIASILSDIIHLSYIYILLKWKRNS